QQDVEDMLAHALFLLLTTRKSLCSGGHLLDRGVGSSWRRARLEPAGEASQAEDQVDDPVAHSLRLGLARSGKANRHGGPNAAPARRATMCLGATGRSGFLRSPHAPAGSSRIAPCEVVRAAATFPARPSDWAGHEPSLTLQIRNRHENHLKIGSQFWSIG